MIASQGHMVDLECFGVRAKVLAADVPAPTWPGLQICVVAEGPSMKPQELRALILEMAADPPALGLGSLVCSFPEFHPDSLEPTPSPVSGRCSD